MTKVYIVRHCEALGNINRIFQGHTDLDISELGKKQLDHLKKRFDSIALDRVFTSPLIRARKTAEAIIGSKLISLEIDEGLIEINGGIVEGKPFAETFGAFPELADTWENHPEDFAPENGEKMRDAYERIWDTVKAIADKNRGKTVACATHGGVTRCLNCHLLKNDISELKNIPWADNTAVTLIEFEDDLSYTVKIFNDASHLPKELINKKSRLVSSVSGDGK